jgi:hypothetical protein
VLAQGKPQSIEKTDRCEREDDRVEYMETGLTILGVPIPPEASPHEHGDSKLPHLA